MKRLLRIFLLAAALVTVLCVSAMAADEPDVAGLYGFTPATGVNVTITPYTASNTTAIVAGNQGTGYDNFYQGAVRFDVTYTNADIEAGEQYLLLVCSGTEGAPSDQNIVYINQKESVKGSVTFDGLDRAYPSSLGKGDYRIYVVGAHSAYDLDNPTATFKYHVPYTLGDVDNDQEFTATDALYTLQMAVGLGTWEETQKLAANVDGDTEITATDGLWILQRAVGLRGTDWSLVS